MIRKISVLVLGVFISSCAIGTSEIKTNYTDKQNFYVEKTNTKTALKELDKDISVSVEWIGNAYPMSTAKGVTGLTNRFVIPYTRITSLLNFKISNNSDKFIDFSNNEVYLSFDNNKMESKLQPLSLDYFKNRWPSFSVKTQEMLIDRSVAIGEVIRTILRDKKIEPKTEYQGYIAFTKIPENVKELNLSTSIKVGTEIKNIDFRFVRK